MRSIIQSISFTANELIIFTNNEISTYGITITSSCLDMSAGDVPLQKIAQSDNKIAYFTKNCKAWRFILADSEKGSL